MLEYILNSRQKVAILRLLERKPEWIFSLSEISREIKMPKNTASRNIKPLVDYNILREFRNGKGTVYVLNDKNYIVKQLLLPLFRKEAEYPREVAREFCNALKKHIIAGILFGSASIGTMAPTSDIDIALISGHPEEVKEQIEQLKSKYFNEGGIIISVQIYALREFKKRYAAKDPLIISIAGGIAVFGNIEDVI